MVSADPKRVVADGYDAIAETYAAWGLRDGDPVKRRFAELAIERTPAGAPALDIGCGTGEHATALLAQHLEVTAIDISPRSIELARERVPGPTYLVADVATVGFEPESFAVVTAFFSLIHVPRDEHEMVLQRIAQWLRPGGLLIATMGAANEESWADDWLGAPMYWSHHEPDTNLDFARRAGLVVESSELITENEDDVPFTHHWIVATRPS